MSGFGVAGSMVAFFRPDGSPCKKTIRTHPDSYEKFILWSSGLSAWRSPEESRGVAYTDFLHMLLGREGSSVVEKHFGDKNPAWEKIPPYEIEAFLRDLVGDPNLELLEIVQGVSRQTRKPYWKFLWTQRNRGTSMV